MPVLLNGVHRQHLQHTSVCGSRGLLLVVRCCLAPDRHETLDKAGLVVDAVVPLTPRWRS